MKNGKLLMFILFFTTSLLAESCCTSGNSAQISKDCSTNCNNDCDDDLKTEDCYFKNCVSCRTNKIEKRCCDKKGDFFGKTFFSIRPQDSNVVRRLLSAGTNGYDLSDECNSCFEGINARANVTLEFQQSFNTKKLSRWFSFDCAQCRCMTVGVPGTNQKFDIDSIELGLTTTGIPFGTATSDTMGAPIGEICLKPRIQNIIADFDFKFDLGDFMCNSWARVNFLVAQCKTKMHLSSSTFDELGTTAPAGFVSAKKADVPFNSVLQAFEAQSAFGKIPVMKYGRFTNQDLKKTAVAGIHVDLGYDLVRCDAGHLGASFHVVFPTGNRPKGKFMFEPIVGANKSWQVGLTVNGSYDLFRGCNDNRLTLFFDSVLTHLFKSRQARPFQLINGPGSEFLILKKFDCTGNVIGLERTANVLHGETRIGANLMFDGAVMLQYFHCNFFGDLGYNFWYRSKEKRSNTVCFRDFAENKYGIKDNLPFCIPTTDACTPDNTTASKTTISTPAAADSETTYVKISDIDFSAPLHPHAMSNKIFGSVGYQFICKIPMYVSVGGEIEFGQNNRALNQWGILGQFGVSF